MSVTQYIGARYVPVFADPVEWSSAKSYEPLTIVLHEGNSFTSKQFVPVGIGIDNETFWAITGNYNAQIELYRRETAEAAAAANEISEIIPSASFSSESTVKGYIDAADTAMAEIIPFASFSSENTVKDYIDAADTAMADQISDLSALLPSNDFTSESTVSDAIGNALIEAKAYTDTKVTGSATNAYVGKYGATEKTHGIDWNSIINEILSNGDVIDFGSGVWYVDETIEVPVNGYKAISGSGAHLIGFMSNQPILSIEHSDLSASERFSMISGIVFDGNYTASDCIINNTTSSGNILHVLNCEFRNYLGIGINNDTKIGILVSNCLFIDADVQFAADFGQTQRVPRCIGISTTTDNQIMNCKFFNMLYAIEIDSGQIGNCYFWAKNWGTTTVGVKKKGLNATTTGITIVNCEFDCMIKCFLSTTPCSVIANRFYWNASDVTGITKAYLFALEPTGSNISMHQIEFNDNAIIPSISSEHPLNFDIYTFSANASASMTRFGYSSKGNYVRNFFNLADTVLERYHITAGFSFKGLTSADWNQDGTFCATQIQNVEGNTSNPSFTLIGYEAGGVTYYKYTSTVKAARMFTIPSNIKPFIAWNNTTKKGLIGGKFWTINEVHLGVVPINIDWLPLSEAPIDYADYTVVNASAIVS